jgi:magnesium transporter
MRTIWVLHKTGELQHADPTDVPALVESGATVWVDLTKPDIEEFFWLAGTFNFHPLAIEDARSKPLHPKLDEYPGYLFLLAHGVHPKATPTQYKPIQSAFFLGENYIVSVYPAEAEALHTNPVVVKSLLEKGPARLLTHLLSLFVTDFTPFIHRFGDELEDLEHLLEEHTEKKLDDVLAFKRSLAHLRQTALHQRELLRRLLHQKQEALQREQFFFNDIQDRVTLLLDEVYALRELAASIIEGHAAISSHRSHAVMRVLTAVSTIFFPLTFVVSLYGMNFKHNSPWNMPELLWPYGYPVVLIFMTVMVAAMIFLFKRKEWI